MILGSIASLRSAVACAHTLTRRSRSRSRVALIAALIASLTAALLVAPGPRAMAAPRVTIPVPRSWAGADSLVSSFERSPARLTAFRGWAKGAALEDLLYVLRRESAVLGDLEAPALEAALSRAGTERTELRALLAARLALASPRRGSAPVAADAAAPHSAYRIGMLLPGEGEQAEDAEQLNLGFGLGLASRTAPSRPPFELLVAHTAQDSPADVAVAFDSLQRGVALVCGGFTRGSAQLLAAASRWSGLPAVLPAVDDEEAGRLSPNAWAIGPAAEVRGAALAAAMKIAPGDRVAAITSSAADTAFTAGFAAACRGRGAAFVTRIGYAAGNASFAAEVRALQTQRITVLFWDGDASEAAPLLRQLTRDRVSLRICGGDGFDPARHHRETRVFLEGVLYAGEDWLLNSEAGAELSRGLEAIGGGSAGALHVRGWLAGRAVGRALASGAASPGEVAAALAKLGLPGGTPPRVLAVIPEGAELPVFMISAGRAVRQ